MNIKLLIKDGRQMKKCFELSLPFHIHRYQSLLCEISKNKYNGSLKHFFMNNKNGIHIHLLKALLICHFLQGPMVSLISLLPQRQHLVEETKALRNTTILECR